MKRIKENRLAILDAIATQQDLTGRPPRQMEIARVLGASNAQVNGLVYRMREEGLIEKRNKGESVGLRLTLKGYQMVERNKSKANVSPFKRSEIKRRTPDTFDEKDVLIDFMKWIYSLDDEEVCVEGWKGKVVDQLEKILKLDK